MRTIILTSTFRRHRFVTRYVAAHTDLRGVWQEQKSFQPDRYATTDDDHEVIATHFAERDRSEEEFFADCDSRDAYDGGRVIEGPPGFINDRNEIDTMAGLEPDVVLVFGTGLLREAIIERFSGRIINLHLGLSPYYRGAGTNFWPLVNREPEFVGATIHYLDAGIDTGPIIAHARPDIAAGDGPHEIGNKAIAAAAAKLVAAAKAHDERRVRAQPQNDRGRLYKRKDFSAAAVRMMRHNFETGMVPEYLAAKSARDRAVALINLVQSA